MKTKIFTLILLSFCSFTLPAQIIHVMEGGSIQTAIDAAATGDTVLVEPGTYYENINFKGKAITVASNFIMDGDTSHIVNTIIDGSQPIHPDSASVVRFVSGEDTTSIIQGFTLTRGKGTYMPPLVHYKAGGGIFCYNSSAKILNNYIVYDSIISEICSTGAGIFAWPPSSNAYIVVRNNKISNNYIYNTHFNLGVQGAAIASDCHSIITGNTINYNESISQNSNSMAVVFCRGSVTSKYLNLSSNEIAYNTCSSLAYIEHGVYGGGVYIVGDHGIMGNNVIKHNSIHTIQDCSAAGIGVYKVDSSLHIKNNIIAYNKMFSGNSCKGGGIQIIFSSPIIENNLIYNNEATLGGGIGLYDTISNNTLIINNTITGNKATHGGGIYNYSAKAIVLNSIIYNNSAVNGPEIYEVGGITNVNYSNIKDGWSGIGSENINSDPLFIDPQNGDFHLTVISPCAGEGIDSLEINGIMCCCPSFDFENDPRPMPHTSRPDIGADEVDETTGIPSLSNDNSTISTNIYPNPFFNYTTIEFELSIPKKTIISIFNHLGQIVESIDQAIIQQGKHQYIWNASSLPNGIYFVLVKAGQEVATKKVIKMR